MADGRVSVLSIAVSRVARREKGLDRNWAQSS